MDKFGNALIKELHDTGSCVVKKAKLALHENVVNFDEDPYLQEGIGYEIQKATLLDLVSDLKTF